jgi:hypothetical protein
MVRWSLSRSCAHPTSSRPRPGRRNGRAITSAPWTAPAATAMPISTHLRCASADASSSGPPKPCPASTSPTRAEPDTPAPTAARCAPTATMSSPTAYRTIRADHATEARATSQAKHGRARDVAARIVGTHGNAITIEDCWITAWARLWGKRIALFSPGMLIAAVSAECATTGGQLSRAGTRATAMSQHCLCGARVTKTLAQRTHHCPHCRLRAGRDIVSAILAACVRFTALDDPRTAAVDYTLAHAQRDGLASQQEWEGSVNRHQPPASPDAGPARTGSHPPAASAEHAAPGPPPNRPDQPSGRHGTSRNQPAPKLIGTA